MKTLYSIPAGSLDHEKQLLKRISEADAAAFTELFETYSVRLAPYVEKLLNSAFWAEEIVQEIFLKLWANRGDLGNIENPAAYIHRMAANMAFNFMKKRSREIELQYHIFRRATLDKKNYTEELIDFHFSEKLFTAAINSLPAQQRLVYGMRHEAGMGYEEIRTRLQISKNTVRNHLVTALDHIRNYMLRNDGLLAITIVLANYLETFF